MLQFVHRLEQLPEEKKDLKEIAHAELTKAVNSGVLVRPSYCSLCNKECVPNGHHADYTKPLVVVWVCDSCHRKIHIKHIDNTDEVIENYINYKSPPVSTPQTNQQKDVAIYTRLSFINTKDDTENQERDLLHLASKNGWNVVEQYKDIHVSGAKKGADRIEFTRMMLDASKRKFDILLFWSLDRLSREGPLETLLYLNKLNKFGVDYKSYIEPYLDSCGPFKDVIISLMAVVAKQERARMIERTNAGIATAKARGVKFGRPTTIVDVVKIKEMREQGKTLGSIAKMYNTTYYTIRRALLREKELGK